MMIDLSERINDIILTILGTILGGFISGLVGLFLHRKRLKDEVKRKHLEEIKEKCLKPLEKELKQLSSNFDISERTSLKAFCEAVSEEITWWKIYSLERRVHDKILYRDMKNHFKKLVEKLNEIENKVIKINYPKFAELLCNITESIHEKLQEKKIISQDFPAIIKELEERGRITEYLVFGVLMRILEYNEFYWPNVYRRLKERNLLHLVNEIAKEVEQENKEAVNELKRIRYESKRIIEECLEEITDLIHYQKLEGKCKYIEI